MHRFTIGALVAALVLAGCANAPLYNEARDKQGPTLTKATSQVDLSSVIDELDKRFAGLRALEEETQQACFNTNRNLEIAKAASRRRDDTSGPASHNATRELLSSSIRLMPNERRD